MTFILTFAILAIVSGTPKEWLDPRIDIVDREAIEQLVNYAIPPFSNDVEWVVQEGTDPPSWNEFLGRVLVIQTWSNQSASGRVAPFAAQKIVDSFEEKNMVALVTIHTPQNAKKAARFIAKRKLSIPTAIDTSGTTCNLLGVFYDPVSIVVDKNGAVRHVGLRTRGLSRAIESLLEEEYDPDKKIEPFVPKGKPKEVPSSYPQHRQDFGSATNMQGKEAPQFEVEQWISEPVDIENKVRVVEFWATWCPPCRQTIPHLNKLAEIFRNTVTFVGVSGESVEKVVSFKSTTQMDYGVAVDANKKMQRAVNCTRIPLAMVISSDNKVRWQGSPKYLTESIIKQIVMADSGETETVVRGRWKPKKLKLNQ